MRKKPRFGDGSIALINKGKTPKSAVLVTGPKIKLWKEINGVEMGVLDDGTPFLSVSGLARLCGTVHSNISSIANRWMLRPPRPREQLIRSIMADSGGNPDRFAIPVYRGCVAYQAIPDWTCLAVVEYYAFHAVLDDGNAKARQSYRTLGRIGFQDFVYKAVGYGPPAPHSSVPYLIEEMYKATLKKPPRTTAKKKLPNPDETQKELF